MRRFLLVLAVTLPASLAFPNVGTGIEQEPAPPTVGWLATGDSFSSGEGLKDAEGACQLSASAYAPLTRDQLQQGGWELEPWVFAACTGRLSRDLYNRNDSDQGSLWEWAIEQGIPEGPGAVDLVTLSFSGNDIGFGKVILNCLGAANRIPPDWLSRDRCDVSQEELEFRIDTLADPGLLEEPCANLDDSAGTAQEAWLLDRGCTAANRLPDGATGSLSEFYRTIYDRHVADGGHLVVVGYPKILAWSGTWSLWSGSRCWGVDWEDADMLANVAIYLDETLHGEVAKAAAGGRNIHYLPVLNPFQDHELCGEKEPWINRIKLIRSVTNPRIFKASFHPNELGHEAEANLLAELLTGLRLIGRPTATESSNGWITFNGRDGSGQSQVFLMSPDGSNIRKLTSYPSGATTPAWSPDGTKIAFYVYGTEAGYYVMNADGTDPQLVAPSPLDYQPAWSPDSTRLAYTAPGGNDPDIWIVDLGTGERRSLTGDSSGQESSPSWSPDGTRVAFEAIAAPIFDNDADVKVINVDGSGVTVLADGPGAQHAPSWSPDGTTIAFTADVDGRPELWLMNADGSNTRPLTGIGLAVRPSWSPDGTQIAFEDPYGKMGIVTIDSGEIITQLGPEGFGTPSWGG